MNKLFQFDKSMQNFLNCKVLTPMRKVLKLNIVKFVKHSLGHVLPKTCLSIVLKLDIDSLFINSLVVETNYFICLLLTNIIIT